MNVIHPSLRTREHATFMPQYCCWGLIFKQTPFSHVPLKGANDPREHIFTNIVFKSRVLLQQTIFFFDEENVYITNTQIK